MHYHIQHFIVHSQLSPISSHPIYAIKPHTALHYIYAIYRKLYKLERLCIIARHRVRALHPSAPKTAFYSYCLARICFLTQILCFPNSHGFFRVSLHLCTPRRRDFLRSARPFTRADIYAARARVTYLAD